ncbi:MAG: ATP-binding protein [Xanthomonadaceae bacterium]|nr:ATP-binding protein [Xanthomonadaceae bacterium]
MIQPGAVKVFIVEDEALIAMELQDRLQDRGYIICGHAARGERAIEEIPNSGADLILMDVRLAGKLSGIDTVRSLRTRCDIPTVFLTAFADGRCLHDAGEAGAYGYLVKPFQADEVHTTIQTALTRFRLERELRQSNAELQQFASAVSHDLRQPLRAVSGHLDLVERRSPDGLTPAAADHLRRARAAVARMDAMVVQLLEYSSVGSGNDDIETFPSNKALDEALAFLAPAIRESNARIETSGEWPVVSVNSLQLVRVFQNLIGNALKFHKPDAPPSIIVSSTTKDRLWRVEISDDGIGIDPADLERVFGVFTRLHGRDRFEGFGLGLAICRRIVDRYRGTITAVSDGPGRGCRISFELPDIADPGASALGSAA